MWRDLVRSTTSTDTKVLIAEACRLTDRLDKYDRILSKDPTDPVKSEARLAAATLARILNGLSYETRDVQPKQSVVQLSEGVTIADEIASRRAARQADAAG